MFSTIVESRRATPLRRPMGRVGSRQAQLGYCTEVGGYRSWISSHMPPPLRQVKSEKDRYRELYRSMLWTAMHFDQRPFD